MVLLQNLGATLVLVLITIRIGSVTTQPKYAYHFCLGSTNDTVNSNYTTNLNTLLDSLSSKAAVYSFSNLTLNGIFGLYLCRGDVTDKPCQICVQNASQDVQSRCPSNETAVIWYNQCMVIFNNSNFFGLEQKYPLVSLRDFFNNTSPNYTEGVFVFMNTLVSKAPLTDTMFMVNTSAIGGYVPGYGLAQCRTDISRSACSDCLAELMGEFEQCCQGRIGWRILVPSCNLRYEEYLFFAQQVVPPSMPPSIAPSPPLRMPPSIGPSPPLRIGKGGKKTVMIVLSILSAATMVVLTLLGIYYYRRRSQKGTHYQSKKRTHHVDESADSKEQEDGRDTHHFDLETIDIATNGFSDVNKLGQGGFGPVYKGLLHNGKEIAVKRLLRNAGQGLEQFETEVKLIAKLQHRNLVRLVGCCTEGDEKLLVYEFMANTSLDSFLFDATKSKDLDWTKRANIVRGIARGLLYLHKDCGLNVIHRDLKAGNILLDDEMNAKISDFGTARTFYGNQIQASTTTVVGTYGYMSPEYAMEGLFSIKSDVYSFGVLLLEIISGRKISDYTLPEHTQILLPYAWQLWDGGKARKLIDKNLISSCPIRQVCRWIHIALLCVQENPQERPSVSKVLLMLGGQLTDLPKPSQPPFSFGKYTMSDDSLSGLVGTRSFTSTESSTGFSIQCLTE